MADDDVSRILRCVDSRLNSVQARLDRLDTRMTNVENRLTSLDKTAPGPSEQVARVEGTMSEMRKNLTRCRYGNDLLEDRPRLWLVRDSHCWSITPRQPFARDGAK